MHFPAIPNPKAYIKGQLRDSHTDIAEAEYSDFTTRVDGGDENLQKEIHSTYNTYTNFFPLKLAQVIEIRGTLNTDPLLAQSLT